MNFHESKQADTITFATVRFHTVTSCPDLSRLLTTAEPIVPRPRKPILSDVGTTRLDQILSDVAAGSMSGINYIAQPLRSTCNRTVYNHSTARTSALALRQKSRNVCWLHWGNALLAFPQCYRRFFHARWFSSINSHTTSAADMTKLTLEKI